MTRRQNFDARIKNSDAAQPRITNVKNPKVVITLGDIDFNFICLNGTF